jgi:hypothetical protein
METLVSAETVGPASLLQSEKDRKRGWDWSLVTSTGHWILDREHPPVGHGV